MIASLSQHTWPDFEEYRPLVLACAKQFLRRQHGCCLSLDDLMQEAWLGMHDASQHLWRIARSEHTAYMARVIRYTLLKRHNECQPLDTAGGCDCAVDDEVESPEAIIARLTDEERELLAAHLGLDGEKPQSIRAIARQRGISPRTLHRRIERCRRRLGDFDH